MNDEPPLDPGNWLHHALLRLDRLSSVPSPAVALVIGVLAWATRWLWHLATGDLSASVLAGAVYALGAAADWAWLAMLPRRGLSFGPVEPPLLGLIGLRLVTGLFPLLGYPVGIPAPACVSAAILLHIILSGAIVYATRVEPFQLGVTVVEIETAKLPPGVRVRLVQVSDLHVERITRRERDLVERVNALQADYVLLTGDYLSFSYLDDPRAIADARQVLGALHARRGVYAVRGTHQVDSNALMRTLFGELPIRWLRSEHVTVDLPGYGGRLTFAGASCTRDREIDLPAVQCALSGAPPDAFTVLLYHTPDLVPEAREAHVDLYLAGHTHGGQIRLPWYGALFTATEAGKRYEMGCYDVDGLALYVSRGIGMEGKGAPRARFLCPPEIVCLDIIGTDLPESCAGDCGRAR